MLEALANKVREAFGENAASKVIEAYRFAEKAHEGQKRSSGEPYSIHPLAVAHILADLGMDPVTICAGLLHDTIEDTGITKEELEAKFGAEIANMVDGVTKLTRLSYKSKEEQQVENLRKMFLAMAEDIRVIIIKLSDRLHNLRTLEYVDEEKQREKAYETLEIYAPLAHRLGIFKIKWELEDTALRYIDPKGYYDLVEKVARKRQEREHFIQQVIDTFKKHLDELNISYEIEGRPKSFYSIYKKMYMQHKEFEQIYDLLAIRVIVDTIKDCYGVLGVAHTLWKPIPGRFKDYIAVPKPNMYQSLHTTVIGPEGQPFELQIRTWEMHRTAEYGIAAHWKYKEGNRKTSYELDKKLNWLRQLLEWQNDPRDARDYMENLKIDLFTDEVFVYTPKGDVIDLPRGATPLDFAYAIHSAIGNSCIGAKANGRIVPLDYELKTGEIVEIITTQNPNHGPSRDWLKIVKTNQAKTKIKQWFKKERREENIEKGKEMLEREAKRNGIPLSKLIRNEWVEGIFKKYGFTSLEDMYSALGYGGIPVGTVISRLLEEYRKANEPAAVETIDKEVPAQREKEVPKNGVKVKGIDNIMVRFARCCNPVPGDSIIGYITRGRGVSIHRADCVNLTDDFVDSNRLVEVSWSNEYKTSYNAEIQIVVQDRQGILADITNTIADMKINVTAINARTARNKVVVININLEIYDTKQLENVMRKLSRVRDVMDVFRVSA
ncbi:MAG: RelA/SpoT family protein [Caldicoprobacterales bacterium]